jgi:hypothetical protein
MDNSTLEFFKNNLDKIVNGDYNHLFSKEEINKMIEMSFFYKHMVLDGTKMSFKYNNINIIFNISDLLGFSSEEGIISHITTTDEFKSCLKIFLRDIKINNIIS